MALNTPVHLGSLVKSQSYPYNNELSVVVIASSLLVLSKVSVQIADDWTTELAIIARTKYLSKYLRVKNYYAFQDKI